VVKETFVNLEKAANTTDLKKKEVKLIYGSNTKPYKQAIFDCEEIKI